jgi:Domain of unknown function (DUF1905)
MYDFTAPLWVWDGDAAWHFVTLPEELSDDIEARTAHRRSGFGSVRVEVTVGATSWATSLFPEKRSGAYVLPIKKQVRVREGLSTGDGVAVRLALLDD